LNKKFFDDNFDIENFSRDIKAMIVDYTDYNELPLQENVESERKVQIKLESRYTLC
jgi:hypothetical protein